MAHQVVDLAGVHSQGKSCCTCAGERTFKNPLCSVVFFPAEGIAILLIGWTHKPSCGYRYIPGKATFSASGRNTQEVVSTAVGPGSTSESFTYTLGSLHMWVGSTPVEMTATLPLPPLHLSVNCPVCHSWIWWRFLRPSVVRIHADMWRQNQPTGTRYTEISEWEITATSEFGSKVKTWLMDILDRCFSRKRRFVVLPHCDVICGVRFIEQYLLFMQLLIYSYVFYIQIYEYI